MAETNTLDAKILKQVEFYFSDSNLPTDNFLKQETAKNDGWVPIETIASFKRMQSLTKDIGVVTAALEKSDFLTVSEDKVNIRRTTPLDAKARDMVDERSIYAKGFGADSTLESLQSFFAAHGEVRSVRMRRMKDKVFKGSVFIELKDAEEATKVAAMEIKAPEKAENLLLMTKKAYLAKKAAEREARKQEKKEKKEKKQAEDQAAEEAEAAAAAAAAEPIDRTIVKDLIIGFSDLKEGTKREDLAASLKQVKFFHAYVDFNMGDTSGFVRLKEGQSAVAAVAAMKEAKVEVLGVVPTLRAVEGEEEVKYWDAIFDRKQNAGKKRRAGGQGGRANKRQRK